MRRIESISLAFFLSGLLLAAAWSVTQAQSFAGKIVASDNAVNGVDLGSPQFYNTTPFGVDNWITSAPTGTILAAYITETGIYPTLVATNYGKGQAVYAPGSLFSEIDNLASPHNLKQEIFLNAVKWASNDQVPTQTIVLVTYGHRELVTYNEGGLACCTSDIPLALKEAGYTVEITADIPLTLTRYGVVVMPGVGWYRTPEYADPPYWSGDAGHAPTPAEVTTLLDFVRNGGGLVASIEANQGAEWMNPIGMPMSVTFGAISAAPRLQGYREADHAMLVKHRTEMYLPLVNR